MNTPKFFSRRASHNYCMHMWVASVTFPIAGATHRRGEANPSRDEFAKSIIRENAEIHGAVFSPSFLFGQLLMETSPCGLAPAVIK